MRFKLLLFVLSFAFVLSRADGQSLAGVVKDAKGQPLSGVSVRESSRNGTTTDEKGEFNLNLKTPGTSYIEFSYVGFFNEKVNVKGKTSVTVVMRENDSKSGMDEVVVIGTQRQTRRTTTSAVSSVSGKQIENLPVSSPDQLLQGRVPGLNVQVVSGEPGVAPTMVVRGNSRVSQSIGNIDQARALSGPLYVIDGIPVNPEDISSSMGSTGTNYLAGINVNDIESIDLQKDAVALAAWGSRGANGVVYIATKKGKSKTPEFRVNVYGGVTQQPKLLPTVTGAEERKQKMDLLQLYGTPAQLNNLPQMLTDSLNPYFNNATDWQGLFYRNGAIKNVDVSMNAAAENVNYRLSANYYDEDGVIKAFGYKRYSLRGNFNFKLNSKLSSQFILGLSRSDRKRGMKYDNSDDNTPLNSFQIPASFLYLSDYDVASYLGKATNLRNQNNDNWYSGSLSLYYDITKGLRFTTMGSANISASERDYFLPSIQDVRSSFAISNKSTYATYYLSNKLDYSKTFHSGTDIDHTIAATVSQEFNRDVLKSNYASGYNIPSNDIQAVIGVPQLDKDGGSGYGASALLSFSGQLSYNLNRKYILYGSYRGDASSRFGSDSRWGYFPAAGLGWVVSDEKFMKFSETWLNFFKLRASYGKTGTQSNDLYAPFNSYELGRTYNGAPTIQPSYNNGLTKNNLTWTKTSQKNFGIDIQALDSRVNVTVDLYEKLTKGDYFNFNLPFFTGYQNIQFNANDLWVVNKGVEVQLITRNLSSKSPLQWTSTLNFAFNKNAIAKLPNNNRTFVVEDYYGVGRIYSVGQPIYRMFQMDYQGVYNNEAEIPFNEVTGKKLTYFKGNYPVLPGYPKWRDVNGDFDVWSDEDNGDQYGDRIATGDPNPKVTGGFVNDFSYKNFNLTIISIFAYKRDVINTFYQQQFQNVYNFPSGNGTLADFAARRLPSLDGLNYWRPDLAAKDPGYAASFPSLSPFGAQIYQFLPFSDMFNEDGSYFKVKSVILGYRIPEGITKRMGIKGVRVYGVADNVFIFKNSTMPDPELVNELGVYTGGAFPIARKYTFGIDVQF